MEWNDKHLALNLGYNKKGIDKANDYTTVHTILMNYYTPSVIRFRIQYSTSSCMISQLSLSRDKLTTSFSIFKTTAHQHGGCLETILQHHQHHQHQHGGCFGVDEVAKISGKLSRTTSEQF
jgi:hypothetical protein